MPYTVVSTCPTCGAPILAFVNPDNLDQQPPIIYNCSCFETRRYPQPEPEKDRIIETPAKGTIPFPTREEK